MADVLDTLGDSIARLLAGTGTQLRESAGPGAGPSAQREGAKQSGGNAPTGPVKANMRGALGGYGGHPDGAVAYDDRSQVNKELAQLIEEVKHARAVDQLRSRFRFSLPYSAEAHVQDGWRFVCGPFSMFDGTMTAPGGGNSTQTIAVNLAAGTLSPTFLLDRYPGALYVNLFIRSFSFVPTGTTMTGLQECWFTDPGGAVVALGIYNTANQSSSNYLAVQALCNTPLTDPGLQALGQINVQNIGIGGTPVTVRWQLGVSYAFLVPDPWFQAQQGRVPTPAERRALEAVAPGAARTTS